MHKISYQLAQFGNGFKPPFENEYTKDSAVDHTAISNVEKLISNVIGLVTALGALIFIIYFLMGAVSWITSGGDKGKVESARNKMITGVLGLVILVIAYSVIGFIGNIVGIDILNFGSQIEKLIPN